MNFIDFSEQFRPQFEEKLADQVNTISSTQLEDAMNYSLLAPGKRLRPLLLLAATATFDQERMNAAFSAAMALEMIHTYSLIHDDLPAMDNDDLRRGRPTNHKAFDEPTAILAGDALLTLAFETISERHKDLTAELQMDLTLKLAQASGYQGMILGQQSDIESEGQQVNIDDVIAIHQRKTGALFAYAAWAGAAIGGAESEVLSTLKDWGLKLGLAFQIRDDLLDIVASEDELGKGVQSDQDHDKATYPELLGLDQAYESFTKHLRECHSILDKIEKSNSNVDCSVLKSFVDILSLDQYFETSEHDG